MFRHVHRNERIEILKDVDYVSLHSDLSLLKIYPDVLARDLVQQMVSGEDMFLNHISYDTFINRFINLDGIYRLSVRSSNEMVIGFATQLIMIEAFDTHVLYSLLDTKNGDFACTVLRIIMSFFARMRLSNRFVCPSQDFLQVLSELRPSVNSDVFRQLLIEFSKENLPFLFEQDNIMRALTSLKLFQIGTDPKLCSAPPEPLLMSEIIDLFLRILIQFNVNIHGLIENLSKFFACDTSLGFQASRFLQYM